MAILYGYVGPYTQDPTDYMEAAYWEDTTVSISASVTVQLSRAIFSSAIINSTAAVTTDAYIMRDVVYGYVGPYTVDPTLYIAEDYWADTTISSATSITVGYLGAKFGDAAVTAVSTLTASASVLHSATVVIATTSTATAVGYRVISESSIIDCANLVSAAGTVTLPGNSTIQVTTLTAATPPTLILGAGVELNITASLTVLAEDYDFGAASISSAVVVTVAAGLILSTATSITIQSSTTASAIYTATATILTSANSTVTIQGNQIFDAGIDPWSPQTGWDYTWDNTGTYADWDNWPTRTWGLFTGPHIVGILEVDPYASVFIRSVTIDATISTGVESQGNVKFGSPASVVSETAVVLVAGFLLSETIIALADTTVDVYSGLLLATADSAIAIDSAVSAAASITKYGDIWIALNTSVSAAAIQIHSPSPTVVVTSLQTTTGNAVFSGSINIQLGTINVATAKVRSPDPYRRVLVASETRSLRVLNEFNRTATAGSETRTWRVPVPSYSGTNVRIT